MRIISQKTENSRENIIKVNQTNSGDEKHNNQNEKFMRV